MNFIELSMLEWFIVGVGVVFVVLLVLIDAVLRDIEKTIKQAINKNIDFLN